MKNIVSVALVFVLVPQIALASWWNPISWFKNSKSIELQTVEVNKEITKTKKNIVDKKVTAKETKKTSAVTTKQTSTQKIENYNYLPIQLNDSLIATYQKYIDLYQDYNTVYSTREQNSIKLKGSVDAMIHPEVAIGVNAP